jgi:putative ATP-dependent endonuclease of the OLD family
MSILIDKVRIKNFRSLRNVEVSLQPVTLLVGANNAGKTTFLRALNTVLGVNKTQINRDDLFIDREGNQPQKSIIIDIRIIPVDSNGKRKSEFENQWNGIFGGDAKADEVGEFFAFRTEIRFADEGDKYETNQYFLTDWKSPSPKESEKLTSSVFKAVLLYFMDAQRDLHDDIKLRTSYFGKLATQLNDDYDADSLAEINRLVKELNDTAVDKSKVLSHLQRKLSELNRTTQTSGEGVSISPFPKKIRDLHKGIKVDFQDSGSDSFSLEYHGMGTRSWASILSFNAFTSWETQLKAEKSEAYFPILALEEPEAHLHPNAQRTLYRQLKNIGGQKIISTHSPYIAGQAELEELRHFYKAEDDVEANIVKVMFDLKREILDKEIAITSKENKRKIEELDSNVKKINDDKREFLRKYKSRLSNLRGELFFSRCIIFCEGETEEQVIAQFGEKYFGQNLFNLGINVIGVDGFENYIPFISITSSLNIPWFVFSDGEKNTIDSLIDDICLLDIRHQTLNNVFALPNDMDIEKYLFSIYPDEIKKAKAQFDLENWQGKEIYKQKQTANILKATDEEVLTFMKNYKTRFAPFYTNEILTCGDFKKIIPPSLLNLFDVISNELKIESEYRQKWEFFFDLLTLLAKINETRTF